MKKVLSKFNIFLIGAAICLVLACFLPHGIAAKADSGEGNPYTFGDITVLAEVDENKVVSVSESYPVTFKDSGTTSFKRSLLRQYSNTRYIDGKKKKGNRFFARFSDYTATVDGKAAKISGNVSGKYFNFYIQKADESPFKDGDDKTRFIKFNYKVNLADDVTRGRDDLMFAFFNQSRFSQFEGCNIYLQLKLPKAFDASAVSVLDNKGNVWSPDSSVGESFKIEDGTIYAVTYILKAEYFNLQVLLPKGYFVSHVTYYPFYWILYGVLGLMVVIGAVITFIFRPRKPLVVAEVTPPELNPLHFSAFWHGYARRRDVCTVVLQWASLGCVKIARDGKYDVVLTRLKDLPEGRTTAEKRYFAALFYGTNVYSSREMRLKINRQAAYRVNSAAKELVYEAKSPVTYVKGVPAARAAVAISAMVGIFAAMTFFGIIADALTGIIFCGGFLAVLIAPLWYIFVQKRDKAREIRHKNGDEFFILMLAFFAAFGTFGVVMVRSLVGIYMPVYDYAYMLAAAIIYLVIGAAVLPWLCAKRTEKSQRFYGRMLGFKRFLTLAELPRIEMLLSDDPAYYFEILPYCMIMGLSKKVDKRFKYLQTSSPDWADGFDPAYFARSLFGVLRHNIKVRVRGKARKEKTNNIKI